MTAAPAAWHSLAVVTSSSRVTGSAGTADFCDSAPVGATVISVPCWADATLRHDPQDASFRDRPSRGQQLIDLGRRDLHRPIRPTYHGSCRHDLGSSQIHPGMRRVTITLITPIPRVSSRVAPGRDAGSSAAGLRQLRRNADPREPTGSAPGRRPGRRPAARRPWRGGAAPRPGRVPGPPGALPVPAAAAAPRWVRVNSRASVRSASLASRETARRVLTSSTTMPEYPSAAVSPAAARRAGRRGRARGARPGW